VDGLENLATSFSEHGVVGKKEANPSGIGDDVAQQLLFAVTLMETGLGLHQLNCRDTRFGSGKSRGSPPLRILAWPWCGGSTAAVISVHTQSTAGAQA
jgi:hypothetical protein